MFKFRKGRVLASFTEDEADLLRRLVSDYMQLVEDGPIPGDPVLARLFPSASLEDHALDEEFRAIAEKDLNEHKRATARTAIACLGPEGLWEGDLSDEQREAWVVLLTDLRLALGVRLGVTEEKMSDPIDANDPSQYPMTVLHYLGAIQESLVTSSSKALGF